MVKPNTWDHPNLQYARIIMLIKPEINYVLLENNMEEDISSIWVKISRRGLKSWS